jgi:hypothetical protein
MPDYELRHVSVSEDPKVAAEQNAENARDANTAIALKINGYYVDVRHYAARGVTTSTIPLLAKYDRKPRAVLLVNGYPTYDPSLSLNASTFRCFSYANGSINVFEPSGLTADTMYNLTFLVLE